jgi:hypothetical protein
MSLSEYLTTSPDMVGGKGKIVKAFFVDVAKSVLSNDYADSDPHKAKTTIAMLRCFTCFNPQMCRFIKENMGFDIREKNNDNTTKKETTDAENFLVNGVVEAVSRALDPEDTSILDRTKTWIAKELGDPKGPDERKHALENLERHLRKRFSGSGDVEAKRGHCKERPINSRF